MAICLPSMAPTQFGKSQHFSNPFAIFNQSSVVGKGINCGDRSFHIALHVSLTILPAVVAPTRRL